MHLCNSDSDHESLPSSLTSSPVVSLPAEQPASPLLSLQPTTTGQQRVSHLPVCTAVLATAPANRPMASSTGATSVMKTVLASPVDQGSLRFGKVMPHVAGRRVDPTYLLEPKPAAAGMQNDHFQNQFSRRQNVTWHTPSTM